MKLQKLLATLLACLLLAPLSAAIKLPEILSNHLVLQQQHMVKLWGHATAGSTVTIHTSWDNQSHTCQAGGDRRWLTKVQTPEGSYTPYTIQFSDGDGEATTLQDVLIAATLRPSHKSSLSW